MTDTHETNEPSAPIVFDRLPSWRKWMGIVVLAAIVGGALIYMAAAVNNATETANKEVTAQQSQARRLARQNITIRNLSTSVQTLTDNQNARRGSISNHLVCTNSRLTVWATAVVIELLDRLSPVPPPPGTFERDLTALLQSTRAIQVQELPLAAGGCPPLPAR